MKISLNVFIVFCISFILVGNLSAQTKRENPPCSEIYYVSFIGLLDVDVSDSKGGKFTRYQEGFTINTAKGFLGYELTGEQSVFLTFDPSGTHYIDFKFPNEPMEIEVVKGCGNKHPNEAVRFQDVFLPTNTKVKLTLSPKGVSDLNYDKDGDGIYESILKATSRVSGAKAADTEPPKVNINIEHHGVYALVTIITDKVSDLKEIRYSLDGRHFQLYKEPFQIQYTDYQTTIYAFADSRSGIRSGLYTKNFRFVPEKRKILTNLPF